jgi:hypothetical protein
MADGRDIRHLFSKFFIARSGRTGPGQVRVMFIGD